MAIKEQIDAIEALRKDIRKNKTKSFVPQTMLGELLKMFKKESTKSKSVLRSNTKKNTSLLPIAECSPDVSIIHKSKKQDNLINFTKLDLKSIKVRKNDWATHSKSKITRNIIAKPKKRLKYSSVHKIASNKESVQVKSYDLEDKPAWLFPPTRNNLDSKK